MFAVTTVSHITDIAQLSHYDDDDDGTIKAPPLAPAPPTPQTVGSNYLYDTFITLYTPNDK